jgi:hypothetical protein
LTHGKQGGGVTTFQHLGEEFWESASTADLDGDTVLRRIREDLSKGRSSKITVPEVWTLGREHGVAMTLSPEHFVVGECARPLAFVAKVWGVVTLGRSEYDAAILGIFLADHAGGDAFLGGLEGWIGRQLEDLLERRMVEGGLGPAETEAFLDEMIAMIRR